MGIKIKTLADLAKLAGVSESTASRALNNNALISQKTRDKIQQLAADYDFKINTAARNLRLQKTNTIAIVILKTSELDQSITDPFVLSFIGVIAEELRLNGLDVLLVTQNTDGNIRLDDYFTMNRADGLIVFGQGDDIEEFNRLIDSKLPIVVWGAQSKNTNYITVGTDNVLGGLKATRHLIESGCTKIAFCGVRSYETGLRFKGYNLALEEASIASLPPLDMHFNVADAYNMTKELIASNQFNYDGIIAASDSIALGMIRALHEANIDVPNDIAIVGYDDISLSAYSNPSLSTIKQDTLSGGKALVKSLMALLENQPVESVVLDTNLIKRNSSATNA